MGDRIHRLIKFIDKDFVNTFINFGVKLLLNPLLILAIPIFLTPSLQGYWYTFGSISAITALVDAGFTMLVTQFAAHEFAFLEWLDGHVLGDQRHLKRLNSIFQFSVKWSTVAIILFIPLIFLFGFYTFHKDSTTQNWLLPWAIYLIGVSINFIINVLFSFFEGCKQLFKVQKIRLFNSTLQLTLTILFLYSKLNLYSLALSVLITSLFSFFQLFINYKSYINTIIWNEKSDFDWRTEFLPLFSRYILSWIGGYLSFNLFTIFAFNIVNSEFAGKVGISISLVMAIFSLSNVWLYVLSPRINNFAAQHKYKEMNKLFLFGALLSLTTYVLGSSCVFILTLVFKSTDLVARFLNTISLSILFVSWFFQLIINSFAIYLRAFKEEPFPLISIFGGMYIVVTTFLILKHLDQQYIFLGFLTSFTFVLPYVIKLYRIKIRSLKLGD